LWKVSDRSSRPVELTARRVYVTTALNPKALVVGLVLLPVPRDPGFLLKFSLFFIVSAVVASLWNAVGVMTRLGMRGAQRLQIVQRMASVWLTIVSFTLIAGVLGVNFSA
jgi:threonine/homoserine/homoserine lactone efflux protein